MTTFTLRTFVMKLPPTPLGLLPECWTIEHRCDSCRQTVSSAELLAHIQTHAGPDRVSGPQAPGDRTGSALTDEQEGETIE
jgi:hypothetical protein